MPSLLAFLPILDKLPLPDEDKALLSQATRELADHNFTGAERDAVLLTLRNTGSMGNNSAANLGVLHFDTLAGMLHICRENAYLVPQFHEAGDYDICLAVAVTAIVTGNAYRELLRKWTERTTGILIEGPSATFDSFGGPAAFDALLELTGLTGIPMASSYDE